MSKWPAGVSVYQLTMVAIMRNSSCQLMPIFTDNGKPRPPDATLGSLRVYAADWPPVLGAVLNNQPLSESSFLTC